MIRCFGGGFREDSRAEEVAWLKGMLQRETQQRQAVQAQLTQEQAKCVLLEQEILQASQAAHEMGESLRQYFSQASGSECSDATTATMHAYAAAMTGSACQSAEPSLAGDTPRSADMRHYISTATKQQLRAGMQQSACSDTSAAFDQAITSASEAAPGHLAQCNGSKRSTSRLGTDHKKTTHSLLQQHLQQRQAMHTPQEGQFSRSSCSSSQTALHGASQPSAAAEFSPLLSKQPTLRCGDSARMQRRVLQVADQLKGLAVSWQQRLDDCQPLSCSSPTNPAMITISDAAAAAAAGVSGITEEQPVRSVPAAAYTQGPAAGAAAAAAPATRRPAGGSEEWGNSSCQSSAAAALCTYGASCDLSSSTGSFVRYRSSQQPAYDESPADISEGDEEDSEADMEQRQGDGSDDYVCCETDEEAQAAQLQWQLQQLEQQQQKQQLPSHSQLQQQAQQQVLAKHTEWQQQQQRQGGLGSWARHASGAVVPGCAITRGAAPRGAAATTGSSSVAVQHHTPGAAAAVAVDRLLKAAGAPGGKSLPLAPRMVPQHQQDQQQNMHSYNQAYPSCQQQQQQHSSPFPSLSGTSCSGSPVVQRRQQQCPLRGVAAAGAGVEHVPQDLKSMTPLRRHQQYLGTT